MHDARDRAGRVALCNMLRGLFRWHFMAAGVHEELEGCNPESKRKLSAAVTFVAGIRRTRSFRTIPRERG